MFELQVFRLMPKVPGVPQDDEPPTEQVVIDHENLHTFSAKKDIKRVCLFKHFGRMCIVIHLVD